MMILNYRTKRVWEICELYTHEVVLHEPGTDPVRAQSGPHVTVCPKRARDTVGVRYEYIEMP